MVVTVLICGGWFKSYDAKCAVDGLGETGSMVFHAGSWRESITFLIHPGVFHHAEHDGNMRESVQ